MSKVTNVIVAFSLREEGSLKGRPARMEEVNNWLKENHYHPFSQEVGVGQKYLEVSLFVKAFNFFLSEEFIKFIYSLKWGNPSALQVFIKEQDDDRFTLYENGKPVNSVAIQNALESLSREEAIKKEVESLKHDISLLLQDNARIAKRLEE